MLNLNKINSLLYKYKITVKEFYILYLLINGDRNQINMYNKIDPITKQILNNLELKKLITLYNKEGYISIDQILVSDDIKFDLKEDKLDIIQELISVYFKRVNIKGSIFPAVNSPIDYLSQKYNDVINNNIEKHKEIVKITKKYVNGRKEGNIGLTYYIENQAWEAFDDQDLNEDLFNQI